MSSPVSSYRLLILLQQPLECPVAGGVVDGFVLPAVPDDEQPGAGAVVEVGGPGAGAAGVAGEVGDGVAELFVAGPAEADRTYCAGLAGGRCGAGEAGQGFGGGEPGAAVADLGEQAGGADGAGAGQRGEDVRVGVQGELLADLLRQGLDLAGQDDQDGVQGAGDAGVGQAVVAGGAAGCGGQPGVQDGGVGAAAVAGAGQPGSQAPGAEPVGAVLGVEAGEEAQADRRVDLGEQPGAARERKLQVGAELVRGRDPVADEVLTSPAGAAQADRGRAVGDQRCQPGAVGAQGVGQDERVEPVVLVAGRAVPAAQVLDLVRADHHDGDPRAEQGIDDRPVGSLD